MKNVQPSYFSLLATVVYSPSVSLKQMFLTKENIQLHIQYLKLVYSEGKITSGFFKHKRVVEEAKMRIKLIAVDSNHFKI